MVYEIRSRPSLIKVGLAHMIVLNKRERETGRLVGKGRSRKVDPIFNLCDLVASLHPFGSFSFFFFRCKAQPSTPPVVRSTLSFLL